MKTKKIVIIQTGEAIVTAKNMYGDFDRWFIRGMGVDESKTQTFRVFEQLVFPKKQDVAGIIITGSSAMVTEEAIWSEATICWLEQFISTRVPIIGVCYGHQILAKLLGGIVDWNPNGRELGLVTMRLTENTRTDILFSQIVDEQTHNLKFLASHQQSVISLPQKATLLGATKIDKNHCFSYDNHIWGLQFHPEFTPEIIKDYIRFRYDDIKKEGLNPDQMIAKIENITNGPTLLQKFAEICFQ